MKIHRTLIEKRECHTYAEITDDVIKRLPQHDLTNTSNWSEAQWEMFWQDLYVLSEEGAEQIIETDVVLDYDDEVLHDWIEEDN